MGTVVLNILTLIPLLLPIFRKILPKIMPKLAALLGGLGSLGGVMAKGGVIAAIVAFISKIWGFIARFPLWLKGLFAFGGKLYFIRWALVAIVFFFKHPLGWFAILVLSAFFPVILEKIFLVVGVVLLKIFVVIFRMGKTAINGVAASGGGLSVVDEFRDNLIGSLDAFPPCMLEVMGYLHIIEDLGMFFSLGMLLVVVAVFKRVYGNFMTT